MRPLFSIIMAVFRAEGTIERAISSVLGQDFEDYELIIVDDCGGDKSVEIAQKMAAHEPRIKLIHNAKNLKQHATRAAGLAAAGGEYVLCLDADDVLAPGALATLAAKIGGGNRSRRTSRDPRRLGRRPGQLGSRT